MHNYNYVNTLWFGTVSFDSCSRFILCLYCFVYYVYDNPTYEVANKLICILLYDILVSDCHLLLFFFFRFCAGQRFIAAFNGTLHDRLHNVGYNLNLGSCLNQHNYRP